MVSRQRHTTNLCHTQFGSLFLSPSYSSLQSSSGLRSLMARMFILPPYSLSCVACLYRTLRKLGAKLLRVKVDIKDFEPTELPSLSAGQPWVAMGKHLCGAATDFTLRCVARSARCRPLAGSPPPATAGGPPSGAAGSLPVAGHSQSSNSISKTAVQTSVQTSECAVEQPAEGASTAPSLSSGLATVSVDTSCSGAHQTWYEKTCTHQSWHAVSRGRVPLPMFLVPMIDPGASCRGWFGGGGLAGICSGHVLPSPLHMEALRGQDPLQEPGILGC